MKSRVIRIPYVDANEISEICKKFPGLSQPAAFNIWKQKKLGKAIINWENVK